MSRRRGVVTDYAGEELRIGDLVCYSARQGNRVRMVDAVVMRVKVERLKGRLIPFLLVSPTGNESGFTRRKTSRATEIHAEHVRLILPGFGVPDGD